MPRMIGVVTSARSDYGIYQPILRTLSAQSGIAFGLYVTGMHLLDAFGRTVQEIEADGWPILDKVPVELISDSAEAVATAMGATTMEFAGALGKRRPDILVVLGDRFEMHAAALASVPFNIPLAHIHGGELSLGSIDDVFRHSLTKMAHLHFAATEDYGRRIVQMGEEPWRVTVSGAPSLDNFATLELPSAKELAEIVGMPFSPPPLIVTFHSTTREFHKAGAQVEALLSAPAAIDQPVVFTAPNADVGGRQIDAAIRRFVGHKANTVRVENLGVRNYFGAMAHAAAMVGNSSSGLIEAPSFGLPVVNVGFRQQGRTRGANVIDVPCESSAIVSAIQRALTDEFRRSFRGQPNPYGDGKAAARIVDVLSSVAINERLVVKRFHGPS